jgi:DNA replication initiation complex subunit (GINS family)
MQKEQLSVEMQKRVDKIMDMDTYRIYQTDVSNLLGEADTENEFKENVENTMVDYKDSAQRVINILNS